MKNIIIRKVKTEDAEQFTKLKNYVWRCAYNGIFPQEVFDQMDANIQDRIKDFDKNIYNDNTKVAYVAEDKGTIVGLMFGVMQSDYEYFKNQGYADLQAIYIHPDYQGLKISNKFKEVFINWAKENGATKFVIGVLKDNAKARKVYENWGGKLDSYTQPFVKLGKEYSEVFYTYDLT